MHALSSYKQVYLTAIYNLELYILTLATFFLNLHEPKSMQVFQ